jgi:hypothetical protein
MIGLPIGKQLQYLKHQILLKEEDMENVEPWETIWEMMRKNLATQPRCPDHPEYPIVKSLAKGVINDLIEINIGGIKLRSHQTNNIDFIEAERFKIWWNHLLENGSASLIPGGKNNPHLWRSRIVGAIMTTSLPDKIRTVDTKTIELTT